MHRRNLVQSLLFLGLASGCEPGGNADGTEEFQRALGSDLFLSATSVDVGSSPQAVAIGDIDGDGVNEALLTTNWHSDPANDYQLIVFRQSAGGAMAETARYPIGRRAESISLGDLNSDGRIDVALGNFDSSNIGVLYQNAAGTLDAMVTFATTSSYRIRVADLNNDGRNDIVGINWGNRGDAVELFLQDPQGQLTGRATYHVSHGGYDDLEVGDVNHDGLLDIVVMSGQGAEPSLGILLQTTEGTFAAPSYYSTGAPLSCHGVGLGDVTGDGLNDVVVSYGGNRPFSFLGVFAQNSTGTLEPMQSLGSYDIPEPVVLADVDGNGRSDVLVLHGGWNALGVYSQTSPGILDQEVLYPIPYATHYTSDGLAVGDLNGDGQPDLAVADYNNGLVTLLHVPDTVPPSVTVVEPVGDLAYTGMPLVITWTASDVALAGFDVLYSANGGGSTTPIPECSGLGPEARSCTWLSPGPASTSALIRVVARDKTGNIGQGDGSFTLLTPTLSLAAPVGSWMIGTSQNVTWTSNLPLGDNMAIDLSRDGGATWEVLAASVPNLGTYSVLVPGPATANARLRITWGAKPSVTSITPSGFVIEAGRVQVTYPNAPTTMRIGRKAVLTWSHNLGPSSTFDLEVSRDGGWSWAHIAQDILATGSTTGSYEWTVTAPRTFRALLRVTATIPVIASDVGNSTFVIKQ